MEWDEFTDTDLHKSLKELDAGMTHYELSKKVFDECLRQKHNGYYNNIYAQRLDTAFEWSAANEGWIWWMRVWESRHKVPVLRPLPKELIKKVLPVEEWPVI